MEPNEMKREERQNQAASSLLFRADPSGNRQHER
jgi:hypothetical protein